MTFLLLVLGLAVLVVGAEGLVRGASRFALSLGVSPLVVGLTIVAFGTSSPEMAVSVQAATSGQVDLALGNVVGSNVFNVLFILGVSALIVPLVVDRQVVRQEVPIMVGASLLLVVLALDSAISRTEGVVFLVLLAAYTAMLYVQSRRASAAGSASPVEAATSSWDSHWAVQLLLIVGGLVLLVIGARTFVGAAIELARAFGVSELVIGLTIVAAGTSMPEVATSIMAAVRGQRDIAVGNVVGSNTFNILGVLGLTAVVAPTSLPVAGSLQTFDLPVMTAVAVACLPIFFTGHTIARWEGAVFVGYYVAYVAYLVLNAQQHDALDDYSLAMRWVVLPLTLLTLAVIVVREFRRRR
ncbi:MAG: calcium/sodium antiporter [Steroidobacteraceae bacterium]|jgi:cation:H+ antiporter|nr:calcium/sodium antiporter [Steroidobacteraceae bacterium]